MGDDEQVDATAEMEDIPQTAPRVKRGKHKSVSEVPENIPDEAAAEERREAKALSQREAEEKRTSERAEKEVERRRKEEERHAAAEREKVAKSDEKRQRIDTVKGKEEEMQQILAEASQQEYEALVSNCYTELDANVDMVLKGLSFGIIVEGAGGVGKTYRITQAVFKECGEEGAKYTDSFTTPAAFITWLYENRDKRVLIIDDCAGFMENAKILAALKGALWPAGSSQKRIVSYLTTKPLQDEQGEYLPRSFEVEARLIIITNYLNDDKPHVKAVLSRVNRIIVEIPLEELINILSNFIRLEQKGLSFEERRKALDFMVENTTKKTEGMNFRTLMRLMDYVVYAKNTRKPEEFWKVLGSKLFYDADDHMVIVEKLMKDARFETEDDRVREFFRLTGGSRAKYFRLKGRLVKNKEKLEAALQQKAPANVPV